MIREFEAETISHQTASSATQSAIFAFSAERSKIGRMFAQFLLDEGIREAQTRPPSAESCSILSVENRAGALLRHRLPKNALGKASPSNEEIRLSFPRERRWERKLTQPQSRVHRFV